MTNTLNTPWALHIDRDGTENLAVIRGADGHDLATGGPFWRPEAGDPEPSTLAAMRLMTAAPKLRQALVYLLEQTVEMDLRYGIALSEGERDAGRQARAALRAAEGGTPSSESRPPIGAEVRGAGQDVQTVPPGFEYKSVNHDNREEQEIADGPADRSPFPPDPEGTIDARASQADRAVVAFQEATGADDEDVLSDLLADLMHWADRTHYDFEAELRRARYHYAAEALGDETVIAAP